ncbi:hypothetical protein [Enterococcus phage vB_Efs30_KEN14]
MKNTFNVGQYVELKNDNHNGIGSKGDKAYILAKAFKPIDGVELICRFANGCTEGFLQRELKLATKTLDKITLIK